jgi:pimeloyl-ACP methyl ester carboxylesterase
MARFVMVHGAFAGGWVWGPLSEELEAAGHTVEAPDLPGSGDDSTPVGEVTLEAYADRICEVLRARPEQAVLVPNSMGGVVATQAAARCPERVARLVYVAAFAPQDGQSLIELTQLPEGAGDAVQANMTVDGDPPVATLPAETRRNAIFAACSDEVADWATERSGPQAVVPFTQPVQLGGSEFEAIPRSYVLCTQDQAIPPALQRRMAEAAGCDPVFELDTDHAPHLSRTTELAEILGRLAT